MPTTNAHPHVSGQLPIVEPYFSERQSLLARMNNLSTRAKLLLDYRSPYKIRDAVKENSDRPWPSQVALFGSLPTDRKRSLEA